MRERRYTVIDRLLGEFDQALRTVGAHARAERPSPAAPHADTPLPDDARHQAGGLMRVNHTGEIAAQALYQSQALTARQPAVRAAMAQAAREETDHLAWTEARLRELGSHTSFLNPAWYAGSFVIGAVAGLVGDQWNLGFVAETERQVVAHLDDHLARLPAADARSRAILEQMRIDEAHHATQAIEAGAAALPGPIQTVMRLFSRVMTRTAYWI